MSVLFGGEQQSIFYKTSLKIPTGYSESVNRRRTDNTMQKQKRTKEQTTFYKILHRKLNIGGELTCFGRVSSSCSTSDTRRVAPFTKTEIVMNEKRTRKFLRQVEHIRGHL